MNCLDRIFGKPKPLIAMVHLPALPGRCGYDAAGGMRKIADTVRRDLAALRTGGVDGVMFCNEGDLPYTMKVDAAQAAAMAAVIAAVQGEIGVPFGVNLLWDPGASLAVANATGAAFVREVFTGAYESDMGIFNTDCAAAFDYRKNIGGEKIAVFDNVCPEFSRSLAGRTVAERAKVAEYFRVDAVLVSGIAAGSAVDLGDLSAAKAAVQTTPVLANTGVRRETIREILSVADGVIVGTALKVGGNTWNPVDPDRVKALMDTVREIRGC